MSDIVELTKISHFEPNINKHLSDPTHPDKIWDAT